MQINPVNNNQTNFTCRTIYPQSQLIFTRPSICLENDAIKHCLALSEKIKVTGELSDTYRQVLLNHVKSFPQNLQRMYENALSECKTYILTASGERYLVSATAENINAAQKAIIAAQKAAVAADDPKQIIKFVELTA